ncbi:NAD-dependent epimerase/dehydratase family protein [Actinoallomurus iriomotensis]|uniref:NAD-dependent epimerase n=1 Tax=Actinoallomurus iriomotensis TaxID=478107 RepID=A0A9W6VKF0_9ACTN|nr:NAD-dependent epimerase/dehydratase family protein [Actinoallomurus iriomotensis]GLY75173.1 NAD-dependent epimerase [Actinoallomurus iriomotensis]
MRIVILGATGNVGSSTAQALAADPAVTSLMCLARRTPDLELPKAEWASADVTTTDLVPLFRGADAVIHLAWAFQPTHDPAATWRVNVLGSRRVFDAVAAAGVPSLVYASSVGAYSPGPKDRAVDESWATDGWPGASYTREKAYVERVLDAFETEHPNVRVVRLRPGFIFKRESAQEQRRIFAGPLLPNVDARALPIVPDVPGLRFQVVTTPDVAEAYRLAALGDARGAFNIAADPVIGTPELAELLDARPVRVPARLVRAAVAAGWWLNLVPASPGLFDALLRLPIMDCSRAREELGWTPRGSALDALEEFVTGLREGAGTPTPPLAARTGSRVRELLTSRRQLP